MFPGFIHPFTCIIAGPTQSGKTVFIQKILKSPHLYIDPPPKKLIWCYGVLNHNQILQIRESCTIPIEFIEGLPSNEIITSNSNEPKLLIIDDLMNESGYTESVSKLFTKLCHHNNISVFFVIQNLFHQSRQMRDIQTNTNYLIIFKNPRDLSQIKVLERQMFHDWKNYLFSAYRFTSSRPFGYLVIDMTQSTPDDRRLYTGLFPPEVFYYFKPTHQR